MSKPNPDYCYIHGTYNRIDKEHDVLVANVKNIHTNESKLYFLEDPTVPFWITKPECRFNTSKREDCPEAQLDRYHSKHVDLAYNIAKALGMNTKGYVKIQNVLDSPYVYGADIDVEVLVKIAFSKACSGFPSRLNIGTLDIETSMLGNNEIIIITYIDGLTRQSYTSIYKPFLKDHTEADIHAAIAAQLPNFRAQLNKRALPIYDRQPFHYNLFISDNELEIIEWIFQQINRHKPDFVGIWNINFDIPKILKRIEYRQGDKNKIFCHPDVPPKFRYCKYHEDKGSNKQKAHPTDRWHWMNVTGYTQYIDQQNLYARIRKVKGKESNYKLDYIAGKNLGTGKMDFGENKGHVEFQRNDFVNYIAYNIIDATLCLLLEELNNDITNLITLTGVSRLKDFSHQTVLLKNKYYVYCRNNKRIPASIGNEIVSEWDHRIKNVGGAVLSPNLVHGTGISALEEADVETGVTLYDADSDYSALYPSVCQTMNISKETKIATVLEIFGKNDKDAIYNLFANVSTPIDNAVFICNEYFNLPSYQEMLELVKQRIGAKNVYM